MSLALLLASVARCASPDFCPTDADLRAALRADSNASEWAILQQHQIEKPDEIMLISTPRIFGLSDVLCDEPAGDKDPSFLCRVTVRYQNSNGYRMLKLVKTDGAWTIAESMGFVRDRR